MEFRLYLGKCIDSEVLQGEKNNSLLFPLLWALNMNKNQIWALKNLLIDLLSWVHMLSSLDYHS